MPGFLLAIFALQDSFGTACNVTGDGALTLFLTGYAEMHNITESKVGIVANKAVKATRKVAGAVKKVVKRRKK